MNSHPTWADFNQNSYINKKAPSELFLGRGMLSNGEVKALFASAATFFANQGSIVDAGAFAGMSAHSFATGLKQNHRASNATDPIIHSYDKFIADDPYVRDYLTNVFYSSRSAAGTVKEVLHQVEHAEDFLHVFWHQNQRHTHLIEAHQGDFGAQAWSKKPIEILFVDVCKTKALQDHVLKEFMPHMIPGESLLIQQDFHHAWHPYIHLAMEVLAPCFDTLVAGEAASRFYICREIPSATLLKQALELDFDAKDIMDAYDAIQARSGRSDLLQLARVKALVDAGFREEAQSTAAVLRPELRSTQSAADLDQILR